MCVCVCACVCMNSFVHIFLGKKAIPEKQRIIITKVRVTVIPGVEVGGGT